jgi:hypothetical protein
MRKLCFTFPALIGLAFTAPVAAADLLPANRPIPEVVDHYIDLQLKDNDIQAAPQADDATILRRLTLDLVGRIPTAAEMTAYLDSKDPEKKVKLVDRLLASAAFARHQVNEFDAMLTSSEARRNGGSVREYLGRAMKENRSWDLIFKDLILADEKEPVQKGSSEFLRVRLRDLDRLTTEVSILFFGVNVSCAQCHDHPLVHDWKQDHYYGMKSFFSRTYLQGRHLAERDTGVVQFKTTKAETKTARVMFLTGAVVEIPGQKPLTPDELKALREAEKKNKKKKNDKSKDQGPPPAAPKFSVRQALVNLALQPGQRDFFARSIVNRLWHRLFGLGLVTPLDQMHSENIASHPELLTWLARDMAENKYDLRRMIRGLVLSKAYARSSRWEGERWPMARSFAVARLRALTPMQMATSLRLATASPEQMAVTVKSEDLERRLEGYENQARGFANLFEQPRDDFQISVTEALLFSNGERIQRELLAEGNDRLLGRLASLKTPEEAVEAAVRNVLARPARAEEKRILTEYLASRRDRQREAYRQMVWALLSSAEFRFNH